MSEAEWLAGFCEAMYVLARFYPPSASGWLRGRQWERLASSVLGHTGSWAKQGPGSLTLFGCGSASGFLHEIDAAASRHGSTLICEAKAYVGHGPSKADICTFDRKTFDIYVERRRAGEPGPHWRILISASPLDDAVRQYCYLYGIVVVDPELVPLPVLLRMASRQSADEYFRDNVLGELVRLGELGSGSMERRYVPDGPNHLRFDLRAFDHTQLDDLLWLQKSVTSDLLELVDREKPGHFEDRACDILARIGVNLYSEASSTVELITDGAFGLQLAKLCRARRTMEATDGTK